MANIEKRGKNSYRFSVFIGEDEHGKKLFKRCSYKAKETAPSKLKKELEKALADYENKVRNGELYEGDKITFRVFFETWKKEYGQRKLTEYERNQIENNIKRIWIASLGHLKIGHIKAVNLQKVINSLNDIGLAPATVVKYFSAVRSVFSYAYRMEVIKDDPCKRVELPSVTHDSELHTFTIEQAKRFLEICKSGNITVKHAEKTRKNGRIIPAYESQLTISKQHYAYFMLSILGGFRRGEIISLQWSDIDFKKGLITIDKSTSTRKGENGKTEQYLKETKTSSSNRTISIPYEAFTALKEWKEEQEQLSKALGTAWKGSETFDSQFVFIQNNGLQMDLNTPYHKFREIIEAYNSTASDADKLPVITLHDLRHTSASIMVSMGYDLPTIARRLGHSQVTTTLNRYTHSINDDSIISNGLSEVFFAKPKEEALTASEALSPEEWELIRKYRAEIGEKMGNYCA